MGRLMIEWKEERVAGGGGSETERGVRGGGRMEDACSGSEGQRRREANEEGSR